MPMKIGAAVASRGSHAECLDELVPKAIATLDGQTPDLGVVTLTNHFEEEAEPIARAIREKTGVRTLVGCSAEGVIGPATEVERRPAIALWLASLPDVRIRGFHIHPSDLEDVQTAEELRTLMRVPQSPEPHFLLLADPFFTPYVIGLLEALGKVFPQRPVFGGMASGAEAPGQAALILDDDVFREGAVAVCLSGDVVVSAVVSQGCRPVGKPYVITAAERNKIKQLGGQPALSVLNEVFQSATPHDQQLMSQGIFIGRAISEYQETFGRGDFLIRNVIGADKGDEAIFMADLARVGTTVQFHVRDASSADEDLRGVLRSQQPAAAGGLMFSCNGRGTRMFPAANHDIHALEDELGRLPVIGAFCAGEIGPVGGQTFVHGHTASIALFRPASM